MSGRQGFDDGADWLLAQLAGDGASGSAPQASPPQSPPPAPSGLAAPAAPVPPPASSTPATPPRRPQHEEVLDWFSLAEPPARDDSATRALPVIGDPGQVNAPTGRVPADPAAPFDPAPPAPWGRADLAAGSGAVAGAAASGLGAAPAAMPPAQTGLPSWTPPFTVAPPAPTVRLTEVEPPVGGGAAPAPAAPIAERGTAHAVPTPGPSWPTAPGTPVASGAPVAPAPTAAPASPPAQPQPAPAAWGYTDTSAPVSGIPVVDSQAASAAPVAPAAPSVPAAPPGPVTPPASFALTWGDQELESEAALRAAFQQLSESTASIGATSAAPAAFEPAPAPEASAARTVMPEPAPAPAPAEPTAAIDEGPFAGFSAPTVARSSFTPVGGIPVQQPHPTAPPEAPAGWGEAPAPRAASYDDELWAALNEPEPRPDRTAAAAPAFPAPAPAPTPTSFEVAPTPAAEPAAEADRAPAPSWTPGRAWTDFATAQPAAPVDPRPLAEPEPLPPAPSAPFEYVAPVATPVEYPATHTPAPVDTVALAAPVEVAAPTIPAEPVEQSDGGEPTARRTSRFDAFAEELTWTPRAERRPEHPDAGAIESSPAFPDQQGVASVPFGAGSPDAAREPEPADGMLSAPRAPFPAFAVAATRPEPAPLGGVPPVDDLLAALGGGAVADAAVAQPAAPAAFAGIPAGAAAAAVPVASAAADGLGELGLGFDDEGGFADGFDGGFDGDEIDEQPAQRGRSFRHDRGADDPAGAWSDDAAGAWSDDAESGGEPEEPGYLWNLQPDPNAEDPRAESPGSVSAILAGRTPAPEADSPVDEPPLSSGLGSLVRIAPEPEPEAEPEPEPGFAAEFAPENSFSDPFAPRTAAFEQFDAEQFDARPDAADPADDGLAALFGSVTATGPLRLVDPSIGRPVDESYPATALLQTSATAQLFGAGAGAGAGAGSAGGGAVGGAARMGGGAGSAGGRDGRGPSGPSGPSYGASGAGGGSAGNGGTGGTGGGKRIGPLVWIAGGLVAVLVLVGLFFLGTLFTNGGDAGGTPTDSASAAASETPAPAPTAPQPAGVHAWNTLFGGECLESFTDAWQEEYTVVDCAAPHAAQLVYRGTLPGDAAAPYPGEAELAAQMNLLCTAPGVIDVAAVSGMADLQVQGSYPATAEQWDAGARDYYCFANRSGGEPLTASIAGPGPAA